MKKVILSFVLIVFSLRVSAEGITIEEGTTFELQDGTTLKLPAGSVLQVDYVDATHKGKFKAWGVLGDSAVITRSDIAAGNDSFSVNIEGTIDCKYFIFEYMDENGVYLRATATIDIFSYGRLTEGANTASSCLLRTECTSNTFDGILFDKPVGNEVAYNVRAITNPAPGYWHFANCPTGDNFGGDQYDNDPGDTDASSAVSQGAIIWANPYAVELLGWDCVYRNREVQVSWLTEVELNNYKWIIERREKGDTSYIIVHQEAGYTAGKNYLWIDSTVIEEKAYYYRLADFDGGDTTYHGEKMVYIPGGIDLSLYIPNPFPEKASIHYSIPEGAGNLRITIYDRSGRRVCTLINGKKKSGHYTTNWDGTDDYNRKVGTGIYFVRFELELASKKKFVTTKKATLIR